MLLLIIELVSMIEKLLVELNDISQQIKEHIQKNASETQNQEEYSLKYNKLTEKCTNVKQLIKHKSKIETMSAFIRTLQETKETLQFFDDNIWRIVVEKVTVFHDCRMIFQFIDRTEIET